MLEERTGHGRRQRPSEAERVAGVGVGEVESVAGEDFQVGGGGGFHDGGAERGISGFRADGRGNDVVLRCR